jgi:hypothetical protein
MVLEAILEDGEIVVRDDSGKAVLMSLCALSRKGAIPFWDRVPSRV